MQRGIYHPLRDYHPKTMKQVVSDMFWVSTHGVSFPASLRVRWLDRHFWGVDVSIVTLMQFVTLDSVASIYFPLISERPLLGILVQKAFVVLIREKWCQIMLGRSDRDSRWDLTVACGLLAKFCCVQASLFKQFIVWLMSLLVTAITLFLQLLTPITTLLLLDVFVVGTMYALRLLTWTATSSLDVPIYDSLILLCDLADIPGHAHCPV